jgi:hypothetical protein
VNRTSEYVTICRDQHLGSWADSEYVVYCKYALKDLVVSYIVLLCHLEMFSFPSNLCSNHADEESHVTKICHADSES